MSRARGGTICQNISGLNSRVNSLTSCKHVGGVRSSWGEHLQQSGVFNNPHEAFERGGTWYFRPRRLQPYRTPSASPSSLGRTAADTWDECAGCPVSLGSYSWRALNHNSPAAAYEAERDLRGEPGAQPLDFVIIHWPKSLPPARHAIFITPAECIFPPLHCGTEPLLGIYAGNSFFTSQAAVGNDG